MLRVVDAADVMLCYAPIKHIAQVVVDKCDLDMCVEAIIPPPSYRKLYI